MSRILLGVVLTVLLCGAPIPAEEKPKDKPPIPGEKIDAKADRSLTGFIEKIDAKDEKNGTLVLRTSKDLPRYTFQIDSKTKILVNTMDPLELGLQSPLLKGAEVRVVFVDRQPKGEKDQPDIHICRTLQLLKPVK